MKLRYYKKVNMYKMIKNNIKNENNIYCCSQNKDDRCYRLQSDIDFVVINNEKGQHRSCHTAKCNMLLNEVSILING